MDQVKEEKKGTDKEEKTSREGKPVNEMKVLRADGKSYTIGGKNITQKPLVLRHFSKLFELIMDFIGTVIAANPELLKSQSKEIEFTPELIISLAHTSSDAMDKVYDLITMLLRDGKDLSNEKEMSKHKEFLLDNMELNQFIEVLGDAIELNDIKEIVENFSRMGRQVTSYLKKK